MKTTETKHTAGLNWDGCGVNDSDEYRSRIATFTEHGRKNRPELGPVFAAAPELLEALETILDELSDGRGISQLTGLKAQSAIQKAKGGAA